jgi:hypothetical protein
MSWFTYVTKAPPCVVICICQCICQCLWQHSLICFVMGKAHEWRTFSRCGANWSDQIGPNLLVLGSLFWGCPLPPWRLCTTIEHGTSNECRALGGEGEKSWKNLRMSFVHSLGHWLTYATNTHDVGCVAWANSWITSQTIKGPFSIGKHNMQLSTVNTYLCILPPSLLKIDGNCASIFTQCIHGLQQLI